MRLLYLALVLSCAAATPALEANDLVLRTGYKYNEYPQNRLRFIPVVESTPVTPDPARELQHSFETELEYRFFAPLDRGLYLTGLFFAQTHLGRVNPVGLHVEDAILNVSSFEENFFFGATFPELFLGYESNSTTFDFGLLNPVYGNSAIQIADVFSKTRRIVSLRRSEDSTTELRQGNLGVRMHRVFPNFDATLIYMPDLPGLYDFSNLGHRLFAHATTETQNSSISGFLFYQTRDNYDGPYTAQLDVYCETCQAFNVPRFRETDNVSLGMLYDHGINDNLTFYSETLVSSQTSKFNVQQIGPIRGGLFLDEDVDAVRYTRDDDAPYVKLMVGLQYSLTPTDLARVEYIHTDHGLTPQEKDTWYSVLDQSMRLDSVGLNGDLRDFVHYFGTFSRDYLMWNYEARIGETGDNLISLGQIISLDDHSSLDFLAYSIAVTTSTTFHVLAKYADGPRRSDFGSLGERTAISLYFERRI